MNRQTHIPSGVGQVPLTDAPTLSRKESQPCPPSPVMWSATPATQCTLYWRFGHPAAGCPKCNSNPQCCRICGDSVHTARSRPCRQCLAEPSMPKKVDGIYPHASPRASTVAPTTQPTSPLPRSLWKRLRNSAPRQTNWVEASPLVKPRNASRLYAGGSFPEGLDLKSTCTWYETTVTEVLPVLLQRNLIALPPSDDNLEDLLSRRLKVQRQNGRRLRPPLPV